MASAFVNLLRAMWISAKIIGGIGAFLLLLNVLQHPPEQVVAAFAARWLFC